MSIFSSLVPEAHPNHNVFDQSRRDVFSQKSAMLVPCFIQHTIPNATYEITPVNQIEVSAMAKANFARMKQNVEYFFVPYSQIWRWFETFYYQRLDTVRSPTGNNTNTIPQYAPNFNLDILINFLWNAYVFQRVFSLAISHCKVASNWSAVIQGNQIDFKDSTLLEDCSSTFFGDCLNNFSSLSVSATANLVVSDLVDIHGRFCVEDILRNLDLLGYGNFLPLFKEAFNTVGYIDNNNTFVTYFSEIDTCLNLYFENIDPDDDAVSVFINAFDISSNANLFQPTDNGLFLNNRVPFYTGAVGVTTGVHFVSPFPIFAYLKIWSDNFRNTQYDNADYSYIYNLDWLYQTTAQGDLFEGRIVQALVPRYRMYRRDILTGTYPSAQFGNVAVASLQNPTSVTAVKVGSSNTNVQIEGVSGRMRNSDGDGGQNYSFNVNSGVSALAVRQAEALQRYKEKNLRAGNRLKNQQNAFFGDTSRYLQDDYSQFLFSTDSDLLINSVTATAESSEVNLGDKGSTGVSSLSAKSFTFNSHDFGIILGVSYILPVAEYDNFGFDPHIIKLTDGDFFHPDLQNLGLAPVFNNIVSLINPVSHRLLPNSSISVLGYSAHDWEYKCSLDKVHGEFNTVNGVFGDYVTPRNSSDFSFQKLSNLYASPSDIDNIFYVAADETQATDQFKVNMYHRVKSVLPMSVTGLPY